MKYYRVIDEDDKLIGYTSSYVEEIPDQLPSRKKEMDEMDASVGLEPSDLSEYDGVFDG
jgi:hypothetical protein